MDAHVSKGIAQLDPSLKDMILNPKMKKICRPPNAFMVFAREHRKDLAKEHPEISNKFISSMLGKMWKETPNAVKTEYFKKAHLLSELHKARYPDYVYSPREARIQKLKKIRKRDPKKGVESTTDPKYSTAQHLEERNSSQDEEWTIDTSNEGKTSSPEYVPNNPEYFTQNRPESRNGERWDMDQTYPKQYADEFEYYRGPRDVSETMDRIVHPENDYWWYTRPQRYGYCNPARIESRSRCIPSWEGRRGQEAVPYLPEHYSLGTSPSLCSSSRSFARPLSPFYYRSPCPSPIPRSYQPYWRPPSYYDDEDYICEENVKPYSFPTSCRAPSPDYFPQSFGYVDKPYGKMNRSPTSYFGYQGQGWDSSRKIVRDETLNVTPVSPPCLRRSKEIEDNLSNPYYDAGNEENMLLRSSKIVVSETKKQALFPCFSELESRQHETASSSTHIAASDELNLLNTQGNNPRKTQSYTRVSSAEESMKGTPFGGYFPTDHHLSSLRNPIRGGHIVHPYSSKMTRQLERASSSRLPYCPQSMYRSNSALDPYIRNMDTADYYRASDPKFYNESRFHIFGPEGRPRKLSKVTSTETVGNDSQGVCDNTAEKLDDRTVWSFAPGSLSHDNINDHLEETNKESNKLDSMDRNNETGGEFEEDEDINVVNIDYIGAHVEIAGDNELVPSSELEAEKSEGKIESIDHRMITNSPQHGPAAKTGVHILNSMTKISGYGGENMYEHENTANSSHKKSEVQFENRLLVASGEEKTGRLNIPIEDCKKPEALCSNIVLKLETESISPAKAVTHSDRITVDQKYSEDRCCEASVTLERLPGFSTFEAKVRQNIYFMNNITENEKSADDRLDILSMPSLVKNENV